MEVTREWTEAGLIVKHANKVIDSRVLMDLIEIIQSSVFDTSNYVVTDLSAAEAINRNEVESMVYKDVLNGIKSICAKYDIRIRWAIICAEGLNDKVDGAISQYAGPNPLEIKRFSSMWQAMSWVLDNSLIN